MHIVTTVAPTERWVQRIPRFLVAIVNVTVWRWMFTHSYTDFSKFSCFHSCGSLSPSVIRGLIGLILHEWQQPESYNSKRPWDSLRFVCEERKVMIRAESISMLSHYMWDSWLVMKLQCLMPKVMLANKALSINGSSSFRNILIDK